jgi:hypothetical protein
MAPKEKKPKVKVTQAKVAVKAKVVTAAKKAPPVHKRVQTAEGWKRAMMKLKRGGV